MPRTMGTFWYWTFPHREVPCSGQLRPQTSLRKSWTHITRNSAPSRPRLRHQRNRNCSGKSAWLLLLWSFYFCGERNISAHLRCPSESGTEENMFQETLLESSPTPGRRRGWSLATAFTAQTLIAATLIVVPLLSSAVITISTPAMPIPISYAKPMADSPRASSGGTSSNLHFASQQEVVNMNLAKGSLIVSNPRLGNSGPSDPSPCLVGASCPVGDGGPPNLLPVGPTVVPKRPDKPVIVSPMSDG